MCCSPTNINPLLVPIPQFEIHYHNNELRNLFLKKLCLFAYLWTRKMLCPFSLETCLTWLLRDFHLTECGIFIMLPLVSICGFAVILFQLTLGFSVHLAYNTFHSKTYVSKNSMDAFLFTTTFKSVYCSVFT